MSRLVVHIGLEKTGSTYIQQMLALNSARLAELGVGYPDFCQDSEHLEIYMASLSEIGWMHRRKGVTDLDQLAELKREVHQGLDRMAAHPVAVVTCERLSTFSRAAVAGLHELVSPHFDELEIVVFLRRPDHAVGSYYGQAIKVGLDTDSVEYFMAHQGRMLDLAGITQRWTDEFGPDRVTAWPYLERTKSDADAGLRLLLGRLGVPDDELARWERPRRGVNVRLSAEAQECMRLLNPEVPRWKPDGTWNGQARNRLLHEMSARFPGRDADASPELVTAIREAYPAAAIADAWRGRGMDDAWDEWVAQPPAQGSPAPALDPAQVEAVRAELFAEGGPLGPAPAPARPGFGRRLRSAAGRLLRG